MCGKESFGIELGLKDNDLPQHRTHATKLGPCPATYIRFWAKADIVSARHRRESPMLSKKGILQES
jgi:hypothetical protein